MNKVTIQLHAAEEPKKIYFFIIGNHCQLNVPQKNCLVQLFYLHFNKLTYELISTEAEQLSTGD